MPRLLASWIFFFFASVLSAQGAAFEVVPSMIDRGDHVLVHDPVRDRLLVVGGFRKTSFAGRDIWELDGDRWRRVGALPAGFEEVRAVFDESRGVLVAMNDNGNTAEWDGASWTSRPTLFWSGSFFPVEMVYDPVRQAVLAMVLSPSRTEVWQLGVTGWSRLSTTTNGPGFGFYRLAAEPQSGVILAVRYDSSSQQLETWAYAGTSWVQLPTPNRPPPLQWFEVAYSQPAGELILFGGYLSVGGRAVCTNEHWRYDGTDWRSSASSLRPLPRWAHGIAVHPTTGDVFVHGGRDCDDSVGDLWEWDRAADTWTQLAGSQEPPSDLTYGPMAYDPGRDQLVLLDWFAGANQTWVYDGDVWRRSVASGPFPTGPANLAFDPGIGQVIAQAANGTWVFAGGFWVQIVTAAQSPPARYDGGLAYDGQQLVLFGGFGNAGAMNDTWTWQNGAWTQQAPVTSPPPTDEPQLVSLPSTFAASSDLALLARGDDLWIWTGATWVPFGQIPEPGRLYYRLKTDFARGRVVFMGGEQPGPFGSTITRRDAWEFDGSAWTLVAVNSGGGIPFNEPVTAFDGQVWAVGTRSSLPTTNSVYRYTSASPAWLLSDGDGCAGTAGTPVLSAEISQRPWLGDGFSLDVDVLPSGSAAFLAVGFADDVWNGQALPAGLGSLGAPGCLVHLTPERTELMTRATPSANARWTGVVPVLPSLVGQPVHFQAVVIDPGANAGGFVVSNRLRGQIGAR